MTVNSIIGLMNSGKTLKLSVELYLLYLKGYIPITNYHLNFPHFEINQDFLLWIAREQPSDFNKFKVVFGFDEFWLWLADCRASASTENRLTTYFFNQSSKGNIKIYLTAQRNSQNELRIRENQHTLTICKRIIVKDNLFYKITDEERILPLSLQQFLYIEYETLTQELLNITSTYKLKERGFLKALPFFNLYDTHQKMTPKHNDNVKIHELKQY